MPTKRAVDNPRPPRRQPAPKPKGTHSDRVRAETRHNLVGLPREIGRREHRHLAAVGEADRCFSIDELEAMVDQDLEQNPLAIPVKLRFSAREQILTCVGTGVAMLPPPGWRMLSSELRLVASEGAARGSIVDQVWQAPDPVIHAEQIGDIVGLEITSGVLNDTAALPSRVAQRAAHLAGLTDRYGDRLLGVATLCLANRDSSKLHLAADPDRAYPLPATPLWWYPIGRCAD